MSKNATSTINSSYILQLFYPQYLPHKLDIGHIRMFELMHHTSIWKEYSHSYPFDSYFNEMIYEMRVLYEQLVHDWFEYERFLESELPFMKWEKSTRLF